jgi:rhomboid protease GluP
MLNGQIEPLPVLRTQNPNQLREFALILEALGIPCEIRAAADEWVILVSPENAERARAEFESYSVEDRDRGPVRPTFAPADDGWLGVLSYGSILLLVAVLAQREFLGCDWFESGKTSAGLIRQGQWWRAVTALTLHADLLHVLANLLIGSLFGLFAGRAVGSGGAWFIILMGGVLGNLANALIRPSGHTSVGASTAVFAAVGLLVVHAWRGGRAVRTSLMERWAPIVGGVLLLSFLGTGGGRTDVAAHVLGFLSGGILGAVFLRLFRSSVTARVQTWWAAATLLLLVMAWALALTTETP